MTSAAANGLAGTSGAQSGPCFGCEGTRELHREATQVLGIASKYPGNLTADSTSQRIEI
jgi:hypothetical protein